MTNETVSSPLNIRRKNPRRERVKAYFFYFFLGVVEIYDDHRFEALSGSGENTNLYIFGGALAFAGVETFLHGVNAVSIIKTLSFFAIFIMSVTVHEYAHARLAFSYGDDTAKKAGRLTMNPFKHLSLVGSFLLPLALFLVHSPVKFGWMKPVPVNFGKLTQEEKFNVAAAGPFANLVLAAVFTCL
ncbi:MAG: site-2 protease family protein, partial [Candidatus Omnitrophica bacterium]|nr:site-2 protease family protein [Candidatus Omnitrophota bacterium]